MYKTVSLFSGCGGLDLGFKNQGFDITWAIDFDKAACETYKNNIGDHIVCGDITKQNYNDIPNCDIIIGGSPCQGFSNANRATNFLDNPKNFLVREFIKVVKAKKPKIFVLENVPQILTCANGQFKDEIIKALSDYEIEYKILSAVDYGIAQERKRAIFIGSRIGRIYHPEPKALTYKTIEEAFKGLDNSISNQNEYRASKKETIEKMKEVPQGGNWKNIKEYNNKNFHSSVYKRLNLKEPSITLTHAGKIVLTHPVENRIISIRECARIQSFPDDFIFHGTLNEKYQQLANAVPVGLGEAIAEQIKMFIVNRLETKGA